ncbi:MAG: hemerythrin domain-containing protein [Deltaproteobacteria bacterium]|nr:hemerythrin domain-containing protein [Deltaproteobacteria bacterium]
MDLFDSLMAEHRLYEQLLEALDQCVGMAEQGPEVPAADLSRFADAIEGFDRLCHQVKEERILLPMLVEIGMSADSGMIAAVRVEHEEERELVQALRKASTAGDVERIASVGFTLTDHARCHIYTEDTLLFPFARSRLSVPSMDKMTAAAAAFDHKMLEAGEYAAVAAIRDDLVARYAARPDCIQSRVSWAGTDD